MTVSDLIDYLQQFPPETRVVLTEQDALVDGEKFIELAYLDFDSCYTEHAPRWRVSHIRKEVK